METVEKLKEVLKCIVKHIRPDGEFYYFTYTEVEEMKNYLKSEKIEDGTVEVVIKLPKEVYEGIQQIDRIISGRRSGKTIEFALWNGVKNGTVLPKNHGRLIDADELEELFGEKCVGDCGACMTKRKTDGRGRWYDTCSLIDTAPTIMEADKEKEND